MELSSHSDLASCHPSNQTCKCKQTVLPPRNKSMAAVSRSLLSSSLSVFLSQTSYFSPLINANNLLCPKRPPSSSKTSRLDQLLLAPLRCMIHTESNDRHNLQLSPFTRTVYIAVEYDCNWIYRQRGEYCRQDDIRFFRWGSCVLTRMRTSCAFLQSFALLLIMSRM